MHLLRLLRGELPGRFDRRDADPRVPRREARRPDLYQGDAARRRRPLRSADRRRPRRGREIPMSFQTFVFYAFAAILVFAGLRVITTRNPVHAALWLVLSFFSASGVWLLLQAEFLAIALVLVYVGAVMVLFLFVVMMLDVNFDKMRERFKSYIPVGATVGILVLVEMALVLLGGYLGGRTPPPPAPAAYSNTRALGLLTSTDDAFPL